MKNKLKYHSLNISHFRLDGGAMYGIIPKPLWEKKSPPDAQNRIDLALADIESYLNLNPYNPDLWYEKGRILSLLNKPKEAITAYSEALKYKSNNLGLYHYQRARTYAAINMMAEAKIDLQQAISLQFNNIDPTFRTQLGL